MKTLTLILSLAVSAPVWAETPAELLAAYKAEATQAQPGFTPSAERGRQFFLAKRPVNDKMNSCAACHTENPRQAGSHVITGKTIGAMAPAANPERFTSSAKVEKWFRRNCTEVVGRACSAAEKADFIQFLSAKA